VNYTVFSWDGEEVVTISCLAPGGAAKLAVEERGFRPGLLVVVDEFGERTLWNAHATRLVFANEVRSDL
jgi:hypothetical protein